MTGNFSFCESCGGDHETEGCQSQKLAMIHDIAKAALQTSWLYSGKEHVEELMKKIKELSATP